VAQKCPVTVLNYETKEGIEMEVATIIDEYDEYNYISKSFLIELETTEFKKNTNSARNVRGRNIH
jgi:hypothetical protein